jgi:enoyl-CoA hydratase/carnithine racemase
MMQELRLDVDGAVGTITIDRQAKLNTITPEMGRTLTAIADEVNARAEVRVVVLRGAGDRAFSAGSDVGVLDDYGDNWSLRNRTDYVRAVLAIRKPVIASVHGYAIGGGMELALACDVRYAARDAQFGAGEIKLGWCGGAGETQILPRIVGAGNALHMLLTGDMVGADEAFRIGLVQKVVEVEELQDEVQALAERIAANAPIACQIVKHLVRVAQSTALDVGLSYENDLFAYCFTTSDSAEGRAAFAEKRPPRFEGR